MIGVRAAGRPRPRRTWALFVAAAVLGFPCVVVMPAATAAMAVISCGAGAALLGLGRRRSVGRALLAVAFGFMVPMSLYVALAITAR